MKSNTSPASKHRHLITIVRRFWMVLGLVVADTIFFSTTDPTRVSSILLIVGFALVVATIYYLLNGILAIAKLYGLSLGASRRRLVLFVTLASGVLLALQSIGELTARDALVVLPLAVVLYVYVSYGRNKVKT